MEDQSNSKKLTRKHLAERQRRARINLHLKDIQELTSATANRGEKVKLEKAEVLETALQYLQNIQDSEPNNNTIIDPATQEIQAYEEGFRSCMTNILDGLDESGLFTELTSGLKDHLESVLYQTLTVWKPPTLISSDVEKLDMAFSPSLARLEQCLLKFETGHMTGSAVFKGNDVRRGSCDSKGSDALKGSDVSSDSSQCETGSNNDTSQIHITGTVKTDLPDLENGSELTSGNTINEWVNMQREYVVHQQLLLQYHQQQHQQQYQHQHQLYQQHYDQIPTYSCHAVTDDLNEMLGINRSVSDTKITLNSNDDERIIHNDLNEDHLNTDGTTVKQEVWRPW